MGEKSKLVSYILYTCAYLFSGTVVFCPFYNSGNPIASCVLTSFALMLYCFFLCKIIKSRRLCRKKFSAVVLLIFVASAVFVVVNAYAEGLGVFSDYYGKVVIKYFAALAVMFCAVYGVYRGMDGILGFTGLSVPLVILWIFAGFFAFATTRKIVLTESPFLIPLKIDVVNVIKNIVFVCADLTVFITVIFNEKESFHEKNVEIKGVKNGVLAYLVLGGINLLKNMLLFGKEFAASIPNPDLAAIRLIPMFDFPELSIIVNSFACIVKLSVYFLFIKQIYGEMFGEKYTKRQNIAD